MITSSAMRRPALAALAAESMWYTTDRWQEAQPGGRSPSNTRLVTHGTHLHGHTMRGKHQARRPILLLRSVNQMAPSGPVVMKAEVLSDVGSGNSLIVPVGVMRPILPGSVNPRLRYGTAVMSSEELLGGSGNSLIVPVGVMRPILPLSPLVFGMLTTSVNQRALSGPVVMLVGWLPDGSGNSLIVPVGVMRPILPLWSSVNQRLPSGPAVMPNTLLRVGTGNSLMWPAGVMRPILPGSVNQRLPSGPAVMPLA